MKHFFSVPPGTVVMTEINAKYYKLLMLILEIQLSIFIYYIYFHVYLFIFMHLIWAHILVLFDICLESSPDFVLYFGS